MKNLSGFLFCKFHPRPNEKKAVGRLAELKQLKNYGNFKQRIIYQS